MNHPIQPLEKDEYGTLRFKRNHIVEFLLEKGPYDMNSLAEKDFSKEDRRQFAQLIGYSLGGFGELSYVDDTTYEAAQLMLENKELSATQARIEHLEKKLHELKQLLREPMGLLFERHPDDFCAKDQKGEK